MLRYVFVRFTLFTKGLSRSSSIIGIKLRAALLGVLVVIAD